MHSPATSDESLIALVADGDHAALGTLYDRYGRRAYGLALRVIRDRHLAEDALQHAFLDVWRTAGRVAQGSSVGSWLMLLTHLRSVDLVRQEQRANRVMVVPGEPDAAPAG